MLLFLRENFYTYKKIYLVLNIFFVVIKIFSETFSLLNAHLLIDVILQPLHGGPVQEVELALLHPHSCIIGGGPVLDVA